MEKESSVKISLRLIFLYLFIIVFGTCLCAFIYSLYSLCTNLVAGEKLPFFSLPYFMSGILIFLPFVLILSGLFMCFYLIRHPVKSGLPVLTYGALYMAAWIFLMPLNFNYLQKMVQGKATVEKSSQKLSEGYFRQGKSGNIFYYTDVTRDNLGDGVCIDMGSPDKDVYTFSGVDLSSSKLSGDGFSDVLIQETVDMPKTMSVLAKWFSTFMNIAKTAFSGGFFSWLCFASISLALVSVVGLARLSRWRLKNALWVVIASLGIIVLNVLIYTNTFFEPVSAFLEGAVSKIPQVKNPLVVLVNFVIFILFIIIGLVSYGKFRKKARDEEMDPYGGEYA